MRTLNGLNGVSFAGESVGSTVSVASVASVAGVVAARGSVGSVTFAGLSAWHSDSWVHQSAARQALVQYLDATAVYHKS